MHALKWPIKSARIVADLEDAGSVCPTTGSAHDATGGEAGQSERATSAQPSPQLGEQDEAVLSAYFLLLYVTHIIITRKPLRTLPHKKQILLGRRGWGGSVEGWPPRR